MFPFSSYVNAVPAHVEIWFAASYVADASAEGNPVRAHEPSIDVRFPAGSYVYARSPSVVCPSA
jgi:hypothetical protein